MAKNKPTRRKRPSRAPRVPTQTVGNDGLAAAMARASTTLADLAVLAETDPLTQRFALDELAAAATAAAAALDQHHEDLLAAIEIDRDNVPLASTYPTGDLWAGTQRPRYLPGLARRATDDPQPVTYSQRLADTDLAAELDPVCPRVTADGGRCHGQRVRLAGRRRAETCWTHLSPTRKTEIRAERDRAVATRPCRSCRTAAGEPCHDDAGKPTQPHTARLDPLN